MKIKIYILTYNNEYDLNTGLTYLLNSELPSEHVWEINIINNHSKFNLHSEFDARINKIFHNELQPDFSTGHTSRNWNQALLNGFRNLNTPDADLVIVAQDDTCWAPHWFKHIALALNSGYSYIACGLGDNIQIWTPEALRKIGLWDERFCVIGMAEHDYFFRAALYNGPKSSINDIWHGRQINGQHFMHYAWNLLPINSEDIIQRPPVNYERHVEMNKRENTRSLGRDFFKHKWGVWPDKTGITEMLDMNITGPLVPTYMFYPYFEKDIDTLVEQKYLWQDPYSLYQL